MVSGFSKIAELVNTCGTGSKEPAGQHRRYKRCGFEPWLGRSPGGGNGTPLQYPHLGNPMDGGAWRAMAHGVSPIQLSIRTHLR